MCKYYVSLTFQTHRICCWKHNLSSSLFLAFSLYLFTPSSLRLSSTFFLHLHFGWPLDVPFISCFFVSLVWQLSSIVTTRSNHHNLLLAFIMEMIRGSLYKLWISLLLLTLLSKPKILKMSILKTFFNMFLTHTDLLVQQWFYILVILYFWDNIMNLFSEWCEA